MQSSRIPRLTHEIIEMLEEISGHDLSGEPPETSFVDLGMDSLVLTQVALTATKRFGTTLKLRHFLDECPSAAALADFLDRTLAPSAFAQAPVVPPPESGGSVGAGVAVSPLPVPVAMPRALVSDGVFSGAPQAPGNFPSSLSGAVSGNVAELVRQQLVIMGRQLELLGLAGRRADAQPLTAEAANSAVGAPIAPAQVAGSTGLGAVESSSNAPVTYDAQSPAPAIEPAAPTDGRPQRHGPQLVIDRTQGKELSPSQERHLKRLVERYTAKTRNSKDFTQRNRHQVSDPRAVAGFRPRLKELVYPIVVERSSGCHLWDIDGNEYVDLLNGYGSNFFGYGAEFVRSAMHAQLDKGTEIGPQNPLVEEVASLFREFVPMDRVAFCNTGSEAVLATLRMARTVTGRDLVVMFSGGYHGIFDEVVVRGTPRMKSMPAAPGIPASAVANIVVLEWGAPQSLEFVKTRGSEIAAVLVEPVQSRRPELQPREFLQDLRRLTEASGTALIFDEVVTGFRIAPGGAQEYFGIRADLASYGKVLGGGISIGIVAGKREYMDALDGGHWQFGDASVPEVGVTYFAGTFVRYPLALAATRAVLLHLKAQGPQLQAGVNRATDALVGRLNSLLKQERVPVEFRHFASLMKVVHTSEVPYGEILFCHLRDRGVHIWDGRPCYLTTAHQPHDLDFIVEAFRQSIAELQEGGFYPKSVQQVRSDVPPVPGARLGRDPQGNPAWFAPDPVNPSRYHQIGRA